MLPRLMSTRTSWPSLLNDWLNDSLLSDFNRPDSRYLPAVNIVEGKEDYKIELAAPGMRKEDFKVNLENHVLTISSEKETKNESEEENVLRREFSYNSFTRSFTLPETVDGEKIKANYKDGVLSILVPKKEEAKVKPAIEIKIA